MREDSQSSNDQFSRFQFQHNALPEINFSEVSLKTEVFGHALKSPLFVSSMTLGHDGAHKLNDTILQACTERGWMMGVGSQRRQLFDPQGHKECESLRQKFPQAVIFGNIGLSQIIDSPVTDIQRLVDSLQAQFMVVHCNPLQEAIQPEGTPTFKGGVQALRELADQLTVPLVLKETGCGFSVSNFMDLQEVSLGAVDVSGQGGTHWGRVEGLRMSPENLGYQVAQTFADWGISTIDSLNNGIDSGIKAPLWASGGVRSGLDAAKLLALGAEKVGFAKPILEKALLGFDPLMDRMERLEQELKVAMFCLGIKDVESLIGKRMLLRWI